MNLIGVCKLAGMNSTLAGLLATRLAEVCAMPGENTLTQVEKNGSTKKLIIVINHGRNVTGRTLSSCRVHHVELLDHVLRLAVNCFAAAGSAPDGA